MGARALVDENGAIYIQHSGDKLGDLPTPSWQPLIYAGIKHALSSSLVGQVSSLVSFSAIGLELHSCANFQLPCFHIDLRFLFPLCLCLFSWYFINSLLRRGWQINAENILIKVLVEWMMYIYVSGLLSLAEQGLKRTEGQKLETLTTFSTKVG